MFLVDKFNFYTKYFKELVLLSVPLIIGNLGQVLIGATDVFIAAKHSNDTLAAISIANSIMTCIVVFGMGFLSAVSIIISNYRGNKKPCKKYLLTVINFSFLLTLIFCSLTLGVIPFISNMGFEAHLVPMIKEYMFICSFSLIGVYLYQALREFLLAYEVVNFPNLILILALVLNFILAYAFVFGFWFIPSMGVIGLAIAALIVRLLMGLVLFIYCLRMIKLKTFWDNKLVKQMIKIGYPIGIALFLEFLGFNLVTILVGRESGLLAATHNIAVTIATLAYTVPMSISAAISIKVGYFNGAKVFSEIRRYAVCGTSMAVAFMAMFSTLLTFCPEQVFRTFTNSRDILLIGVPIMHIVALYLIFDGLQVSLSGVLKGLKMTKIASITLISGYWLFGLPFGYYLAYQHKMSLNGFWFGLALSFLTMSMLFTIVIIQKFKKLKLEFTD